MSNLVIKVENLSKQYHLGKVGTGTLSHDINRWWSKFRGKEDPYLKLGDINDRSTKVKDNDIVWALRDINFEVKQGEVLGIIGRNGAGKSTLLKILSKITTPTLGTVKIKGRIAALLEVGTGFHPELSGRENIFLNGAILGMTKSEIRKKFDAIVEFSGVERYLDTPVKRYSSGMYVRLAFAVAAYLEPDILIVDEVLAVGDVAFQNKCIRMISEVSTEGKTCLIVSHNMDSISRLCSAAILLDKGTIVEQGEPTHVIGSYLSFEKSILSEKVWDDTQSAPGNDNVKLLGVRVKSSEGEVKAAFDIRFDIIVEYEYWVNDYDKNISVGFHLYNSHNTIVFMSADFYDLNNLKKGNGYYESRCVIPGNFLSEDNFMVRAVITTFDKVNSPINHVDVKDAIAFQVYDAIEGDSARSFHSGSYFGVVRPILKWETKKIK